MDQIFYGNLKRIGLLSRVLSTVSAKMIPPKIKRTKVMHSTTSSEPQHLLDELICRYSSWFKLKRVCVWVLRCKAKFLNLLRAYRTDIASKNVELSFVTIEELKKAEKFIFADLQKKHFGSEVSDLSGGKQLKKSSRLIKLDPIFVDGLLRVGGVYNILRCLTTQNTKLFSLLTPLHLR